jgi:hypothetical protein
MNAESDTLKIPLARLAVEAGQQFFLLFAVKK